MSGQFLTLYFYAQITGALFLYHWLAPRLGPPARQGLLMAISLFFLTRLGGDAIFLWLAMGYAVSFPALSLFLQRVMGTRLQMLLLFFGIVCAVLVMLWFKYPVYSSWLFNDTTFLRKLTGIEWIGLSYMTFRAVDLLLYANAQRKRQLSFFRAMSYLLFFSSFVAGPINRYREFETAQSAKHQSLSHMEIRDAILRISVGIIKIVVLARLFYIHAIVNNQNELAEIDLLSLAIGLYAYLLYIYLDFAGYCDIAIAVARLFRVPVPENFRFPFLAQNMQDFWNRWHISLSHWCRDHIFFPLMRCFAIRTGDAPGLASSAFSIFVTFFFVGAWHGDNLHWLLYGVYHGTGLAFWLVYSKTFARLIPALYERLQANGIYKMFSILLTFSYVAWGLILTLGLETAEKILSRFY